MGFECSFYRAKKIEGVSAKDIIYAQIYIEWKNNPWNFEEGHYPTFKEYKDYFFNNCFNEYSGTPDSNIVKFYEENKPQELAHWCSDGRFFDDDIISKLHKDNDFLYSGIDKDFVNELLPQIKEYLEKSAPRSARVYASLTEKENGTSIVSPCDGILVTLEDTNTKILTYDSIYVSDVPFDSYEFLAYADLYILLEKLSVIDFDNWVVWYERSF